MFDILYSRIMYSKDFRSKDNKWFQTFQGQVQALTYQGPGSGEKYEDFLDMLQSCSGEALMLFVWQNGSEIGIVRVSEGRVKGIDLDTLLTDPKMWGKVREVLSWKTLSLDS